MRSWVTTRTAPAWIALASGVFLLGFSLDFPEPIQPSDPGAAALPRIAGTVLIILSLVQLLAPGVEADSEPMPRGGDAWRVGGLVATLIAFVFLFPVVGFMEGAALFLLVAMIIGGVRSVWLLAGVPLAVSVTLGWVFYSVLRISLPMGPIGELLLL